MVKQKPEKYDNEIYKENYIGYDFNSYLEGKDH